MGCDTSRTTVVETLTATMKDVATAAHRQIQYDAVLEGGAAHMQDRC